MRPLEMVISVMLVIALFVPTAKNFADQTAKNNATMNDVQDDMRTNLDSIQNADYTSQ